MSKKDLDEFLGKKSQSPLDTDKIYGGNARRDLVVHEVVRETVRETVRP